MHDQPIDGSGAPSGVAVSQELDHELQRWLLLELLSCPPEGGDHIDYLVRALDAPRAAIEAIVDELVTVGLAVRHRHRVQASAAAWRFEELWPHESPF
jgi:hypothetical protein